MCDMMPFTSAACVTLVRRPSAHSVACAFPPSSRATRRAMATPGSSAAPSATPRLSRIARFASYRVSAGTWSSRVPVTNSASLRVPSAGCSVAGAPASLIAGHPLASNAQELVHGQWPVVLARAFADCHGPRLRLLVADHEHVRYLLKLRVADLCLHALPARIDLGAQVGPAQSRRD